MYGGKKKREKKREEDSGIKEGRPELHFSDPHDSSEPPLLPSNISTHCIVSLRIRSMVNRERAETSISK